MRTCIAKVMSLGATLLLATASGDTGAQGLSCEQLRDRIAANAKWPPGTMRLDIVGRDGASGGREIGTCEQGSRRIMAVPVDPAAPVERRDEPAPDPNPAPPVVPPPAPRPQPEPTPSPEPAPGPRSRPGPADEGTLQQYREWIAEARRLHPYDDSEVRMFEVMMCESRGDTMAGAKDNRINQGLFQYALGTWRDSWNQYNDKPRTDPQAAIFATALAWQRRMQRHWSCYTKPH